MCGGFGGVKQVDDKIIEELGKVKSSIEAKLNSTFNVFEPVHYKSQVVAGTNFLVKIKVDNEKHIHVKYHRPLPCNGTELILLEATSGHSETDNL
jgi:cystatin-A/B